MEVTTPLNADVWKKMLGDHPDRQYVIYILEGIEHGFRIGFTGNINLQSASSNVQSVSGDYRVPPG